MTSSQNPVPAPPVETAAGAVVQAPARALYAWYPVDVPALVADDELAWRDFALCAETDPDAFFPEIGGVNAPAKRVCGDCLVRAECLDYALTADEPYGIWGGTSRAEREQMMRQAA